MVNSRNSYSESCFRGLDKYNFGTWVELFYSEMIEKDLYYCFYYNDKTNTLSESKLNEFSMTIESTANLQKKEKLNNEFEFTKLKVYLYLIKCQSNDV
ncbi:hypothetical protein A3Q56_07121 [Intoshia linei]|uniref:Uncharacterized protein n=1 Tax=Intoshia linei TaxID=1819745 RepID=A0A177AVB5_9BILA|nr:hypothetical protein A3Q56_07121 [Intoshia linei]